MLGFILCSTEQIFNIKTSSMIKILLGKEKINGNELPYCQLNCNNCNSYCKMTVDYLVIPVQEEQ